MKAAQPRPKDETLIRYEEQLRSMGILGMSRAGGQILFDLAFRSPEDLIGTPENLGTLLHARLLSADGLTPWAENALKIIKEHSLVRHEPVLSCTVLCRLAVMDLLMGGRFSGSQKD